MYLACFGLLNGLTYELLHIHQMPLEEVSVASTQHTHKEQRTKY